MISSESYGHQEYVRVGDIHVDSILLEFVNTGLLPAIGITSEDSKASFWRGVSQIIDDFTPRNRALLSKRDSFQETINQWHAEHEGPQDVVKYEGFLRKIGYIVDDPGGGRIRTANVDSEIADTAGPQLVISSLNARFALNAANSRWGSLYNALYGTDAISEDDGPEERSSYDKARGDKVIEWCREFLDRVIPLQRGSHKDVTKYSIALGGLAAEINGSTVSLRDPKVYLGYRGEQSSPKGFLIRNNGLHFEIQIDRRSTIGSSDRAGVKDILMESALSSIIDFEDSVAAVDAKDKTLGYSNWLGLNTGDLTAQVTKGDTSFTRRLNDDRIYTGKDGQALRLHGRSLLLVRNVGHLMQSPAILDKDGEEVFEGIMDGVFTAAAAIPGIEQGNAYRNSRTGSIYIVKPKQHGPEEVGFTNDLFSAIERLLSLPEFTLKIGFMDEERRTTLNLDSCISASSDRLAFINTGFLDRTGDEIHTSMLAGPMLRKNELQNAPWKLSYEDNNVDVGLRRGLPGKAQIGKGMWTKTELMADMLNEKIIQLKEGASTAWVPSPTAATLHATHYHEVDVYSVQEKLLTSGSRSSIRDLLRVPVAGTIIGEGHAKWTASEVQEELDNNCQSILGYVVRWVEQGVGCSKIPDIHDVDLMEDRATLRISSQLLANWLEHDVITDAQVIDSLERMAVKVDRQNAGDESYRDMAPKFEESLGFLAAKDLILLGAEQPSGYVEPILHHRRREFKARS